VIYLNNVRGRDHKQRFGDDAFYDLDLSGHQVKQWERIAPQALEGQTCLVASYARGRQDIIVRAYTLREMDERTDRTSNSDIRYRVFTGTPLGDAKRVPKKAAVGIPEYAQFFNARGHFKQRSAF
jgi:hypothetical protein